MCVELSLQDMRKRFFALLQEEALKKGDFTLSSGKKSGYYLDGRVIPLTPEGAFLTAGIFLEMLKDALPDAVGGPTLGADPIAGALACLSHLRGTPVKTFIVRKASKGHGMQRQIEGPSIARGAEVVLVDDVATTGGALIEAKTALDNAGITVSRALVIVDRQENAESNLAASGLKLESIFKISEFEV
jgi:orotate phosphoribosyltransferase